MVDLGPRAGVPRGVALGWCLCAEPTAPCCTSCCCEDEPSGDHDCASCKSIEIEGFDELLTERGPELPVLHLIAALPTSFQPAPVPALERTLGARAPPLVTPPGLRPGAAPLRL